MSENGDQDLAELIRRAGRGGGIAPEARAAQAEIETQRLADPARLPAVIAALGAADAESLAAAGLWLCDPQREALRLMAELAGRAGDLLDLAQARGPEGWAEGLARVVGLTGGRHLRRLLDLARAQAWAREVVSQLPPELKLPSGDTPPLRLAVLAAGAAAARRGVHLARTGRWADLAGASAPVLALAQADVGCRPVAAGSAALAWPGGDLALLEELAGVTAREGRRAFDLAAAAAAQEGRPALLLGNVSLGGPPLWAAPGPWQQGAEWPAKLGSPPLGPLGELARLRARRLAGERLVAALWGLACAAAAHGQGRRELGRVARAAGPWLLPGQAQAILNGELPLAPQGLPWGQALVRAKEALALARSLEAGGRHALALAWGLAAAWGRKRRPLVLPWADKFVISTRKGGDWAYLAGVAELLARLDPPPLLLVIDETAHPASASLGDVLAAAARERPGLKARGLGAFGGGPEPEDPLAALLETAAGGGLVALRPLPGPEPCAGLDQRLAGRGAGLPLAPLSRDGAHYLLAGTGQERLAPVQPWAMGEPAPWLLTAHGFAPLGSWWRRRIMALAGRSSAPAGHWRAWQKAFNLQ
ncbi:MAG: hypothetical protein ACOZHQ_04950 [Thermodesulfobacteriota bacterium]